MIYTSYFDNIRGKKLPKNYIPIAISLTVKKWYKGARYLGLAPTTKMLEKYHYNNDDNVMYYGENKPSVDTPVQLRLYKTLPKINYMIHSHCYVQDGIFTSNMIPCGGLEEVEEVLTTILNHGKRVLQIIFM